jgi:hypothetical protein
MRADAEDCVLHANDSTIFNRRLIPNENTESEERRDSLLTAKDECSL